MANVSRRRKRASRNAHWIHITTSHLLLKYHSNKYRCEPRLRQNSMLWRIVWAHREWTKSIIHINIKKLKNNLQILSKYGKKLVFFNQMWPSNVKSMLCSNCCEHWYTPLTPEPALWIFLNHYIVLLLRYLLNLFSTLSFQSIYSVHYSASYRYIF